MSQKINKGAEIIECLKTGITETKAIIEALAAKGIKADARYIRNVRSQFNNNLEKPTSPPTAESPPPPENPQENEEEPTTIEQVPFIAPPTDTNPANIANAPTVQNALKAKNITGIFKSINSLLPEKYQAEQDQLEMLGQAWEAPLNRLMGKYIDENSDLYVALVITIIVFAPKIAAIVKDRSKAKTETPPETKKQ